MGLPVNSRDHRGIQIRPNFGDYFVVIHVCHVTPCASTRLRLSVLTAKRTRKPNRATLTEFAQSIASRKSWARTWRLYCERTRYRRVCHATPAQQVAHAKPHVSGTASVFRNGKRFLYRLAKSPDSDRFVLKRALLLTAWRAPQSRPTMGIDLAGRVNNQRSH